MMLTQRSLGSSVRSMPLSALSSSSTIVNCSNKITEQENHNRSSQYQCQSHRMLWQEVIRRNVRDRKNPNKDQKLRYEDPSRVIQRFQEPKRAKDGETLLGLHVWNDRHEKPFMKRKRLERLKRYNRDKQHVMDLAKYIELVQEKSNVDDNRNSNDGDDDNKNRRGGKRTSRK